MPNVVRLVNGGTLQVRTGVMQGIGPQGPVGGRGPTGHDGPPGPVGETGPMGQITNSMSRVNIDTSVVYAPAVQQLGQFSTVSYDDLGCVTSNTIFTLRDIGDYLLSLWVRFSLGSDGVGNGTRQCWFSSSVQGLVAVDSRNAVPDDYTYLSLSHPIRTIESDEIIRVYIKSEDNVNVNVGDGALTIARIGSGKQGVRGEPGVQGVPGAQGVPGVQGPPGQADDGFATYADLL